jgi:FG-GAP-like repeat
VRLRMLTLTATVLVATLVGTGVAGPAAYAATPPFAHFVLADFGAANGWLISRHPRMLADITGDGRADIVGFFNDGVHTAVANGSGGFGPSRFVLADLGYDQGWRATRNPFANPPEVGPVTPRYVTDITGDGRADLVGVGFAGVYTAVSLGNGFFGPLTFQPGTFFATGCGQFKTADVNGDRRTDLICIKDHEITIETATGNGGFSAPYLATAEFPVNGPSGNTQIVFSDVTGDGRAELLAWDDFTLTGRTARPRADGTYQPSVINGLSVAIPENIGRVNTDAFADQVEFGQLTQVQFSFGDGMFGLAFQAQTGFGYNDGWTFTKHPRLVADINGDGRVDVVGFGDAGIYIALSTGSITFGPSQFVVQDFGYNQAWRLDRHLRMAADITGDGSADIVGFGDAGVYTVVAVGDGTFR